MPFEILHEATRLRLTLSGTVTNRDLLDLIGDMLAAEARYAVVPSRLVDLGPVTGLQLTFDGIWAIARVRRSQTFTAPFKSAIVAPDRPRFGFARMFQTLNDHPQITVAIFPDIPNAEAWLRLEGVAPPEQPWTPD